MQRLIRRRRYGPLSAVLAMVLAAACWVAAPAAAQNAQQRRAAAEAYDRGTSAWLAGNYEQAAAFFETAHRLAPASAALVQAVRSHARAGHEMRAATLALRLDTLYPDDARAQRVAGKLLDKANREYTLVEVQCDGCAVDLDGTILEHPKFFVEPNVEHSVTASFPHGDRTKPVEGGAGETVEVEFEAPPPPADDDGQEGGETGDGGEGGTGSGGDTGGTGGTGGGAGGQVDTVTEPMLSPWVPIALGAATAASGAVLVWSGLDTLDANDEYEADPTREGLADGRDREKRTNILIGVTAGLGAITAVTAILAALETDVERDTTASVGLTPGGGMAVVEGRF